MIASPINPNMLHRRLHHLESRLRLDIVKMLTNVLHGTGKH